MSVQAITWVFEKSQSRLAARHVLLSIANHADRTGGRSWPSVRTIANEANLSEREVQRGLQLLLASGELVQVSDRSPEGRTRVFDMPGVRGDKLSPMEGFSWKERMSPTRVTNPPAEGDKYARRHKEEPSLTVTGTVTRSIDRSTVEKTSARVPVEDIAAVVSTLREFTPNVDPKAAEKLITDCREHGAMPAEEICRLLVGAMSNMPRYVENPVGWALRVVPRGLDNRLIEALSIARDIDELRELDAVAQAP